MAEKVESICVDCGLCCDGTIFDFIQSPPDEDISKWNKLKNVDKDGVKGIKLPCPYLDGSKCSIYNEEKPLACSAYFCRLARVVKAGNATTEEAKEIIKRTKKFRDIFEEEFNEHYVFNKELSVKGNIDNFVEVVGGEDEFRTFLNDNIDFSIALRDLRMILNKRFRLKTDKDK